MAEGDKPEEPTEPTTEAPPAAPSEAGKSESAESTEANQVIQELEKRITDAFLVFDTTETRQVDVRELGTVVRSVLSAIWENRGIQLTLMGFRERPT